MQFTYNARKAAQASAILVQLNNGRMYYLALIKILYLADRKALVCRGKPITGDNMVSMPHGPVLSRIYDLIKMGEEEEEERNPWYDYLTESQAYQVSLRENQFVTDELSDFEQEILRETYEEYGHINRYALRDMTHDLPEFTDPNGSSLPIDPEEILRHEGWSEDEINDFAMSAREEHFLLTRTASC